MIRYQNIYHMLAYAFQVLDEQGYRDVALEEDFENTAELLAAILCRGVSVQIKRGLMREYIVKEDIVYSMEYNNLNDKQAAAMLRTNAPLNDVYLKWNGWDTGYLEDVWKAVESRANELVRREQQKEKER